LALLPVGTAPASILARHTGIPRSTVQFTCHQLEKKRIIKSVFKSNTYYYTPEPPEKLQYLIDRDIQRKKDTKEELNRILGDIQGMMNPHTVLPKVRFYEGVEGIIKLFSDEFSLEEEDVMYGVHRFYEDCPKEILDYVHKEYDKNRKINNYKSYVIWNDNPASKKRMKQDEYLNRTSLLIPEKSFPFESSFQIYKNKVVFYSYQTSDLTGILIENEHMKTTMVNVFRMAWNYARTLKINAKKKAETL